MEMLSSEGFFASYYLKAIQLCDAEEMRIFSELKNNYDKIEFIRNMIHKNQIDMKFIKKEYNKDERQSNAFKDEAEKAFKEKKWAEAMSLYGMAYMYMPHDTVANVSILVANRSAALFHMGEYEKCIEDTTRALKMNYPQEKCFKIYERQARCFLAKKQNTYAIEAFKKTVSTLDFCKESKEKRNKMVKDAQIMIKMLQNQTCSVTGDIKTETTDTERKDFINGGFFIDYSEKEGRFARAKTTIPVGDAILSEQPVVSALLQKHARTHCENCFRRTSVPVCCDKCVDVIYCSDKCSKEAKETYHKYECGLLSVIWKSGASLNCHLALRLIASKKLEYFLELQDALLEEVSFDCLKSLPVDDYRLVYSLVGHSKKRSASSYFQYTLMSDFLTRCLVATNYFGEMLTEKNVIHTCSLILRNLQILQFNTHEISELQISRQGKSNVFIGGGIYPTLALFNHSCDPSITKYFQGKTVFVNSVKPIYANQVIAENYGPLFTQEELSARQDKLQDLYWFSCECQACVENWPLYESMDNNYIPFRCENAKCSLAIKLSVDHNEFIVTCNACNQKTNILKGLKVMQDVESMKKTAEKLYKTGDIKTALKTYIDMLKIMHEVLVPPFTDYCDCQQKIKDCFACLGSRYELTL